MEKPPKKVRYIFPIILILVFVFLLFLLRSFVTKFFLIQTSKNPALIYTSKFSDLDESSLETEIFNEINRKRLELENDPLEWDERIYQAAKAHSLDLQIHKAFSHQNVEGADMTDRLRNEGLFFIVAAENLFMLDAGTENMPDFVLKGWMKSPGHRWVIVDRDHFYTHGAVGVTCNKSSCYVTFNCADFIVRKNGTLRPHHYIYVNLNDESLGFQESYPVNIKIKSSSPVDTYFFDSFSKMNTFIKTGSDISDDKIMNKTNISDRRVAGTDSYILIKNNSDSITDVSYELIYN
ncbi:MAG: CAP domain-containing protein [Candidatus Hodarchaeales archaeon]